jgi:hypothetical protein
MDEKPIVERSYEATEKIKFSDAFTIRSGGKSYGISGQVTLRATANTMALEVYDLELGLISFELSERDWRKLMTRLPVRALVQEISERY